MLYLGLVSTETTFYILAVYFGGGQTLSIDGIAFLTLFKTSFSGFE